MKTKVCFGSIIGVMLLLAGVVWAGPLPGAIFTTLEDGSVVNGNIYSNATDVYLDGGPGPNAPSTAAGLPEGDYFFQVTDPSGKRLLSLDPVDSRKVHVNAAGVIDHIYEAPTVTVIKGKNKSEWGTHAEGEDIDHFELGAITVQLMPYKNTPNKGGVYKVWMTPVDQFVGDTSQIDNPEYFHGFVPAWSKTDNYKVLRANGGEPPVGRVYQHTLYAFKFIDFDVDGDWDPDEPAWEWGVSASDNIGAVNNYTTPTSLVPLVVWYADNAWASTVTEETQEGWLQTAVVVGTSDTDLTPVEPVTNSVTVEFPNSNHTNWVIFGNVPLGSVTVVKFYDRDGSGTLTGDEPFIEGWTFYLDGTAISGAEVHLTQTTDATGQALFDDLLPGVYQITEELPTAQWVCTTDPTLDVDLLAGEDLIRMFGNALTSTNVGFGTKGYWHNRNGLQETTTNALAYLNSLAPWLEVSTYFGAGDEPIDGVFTNGAPVEAAKGSTGDVIAPAGSALAEQSHFLVDPNAGGDPREQLAQQLDAFVMNAYHRLTLGSAIWVVLPGYEGWMTTADLIEHAAGIWDTGDAADQIVMAGILDAFNNSNGVLHIVWSP